MPRASDIPVCPGPPAIRSVARTTQEYAIGLVTPLFGGGVEAGNPDESMPIRGTSIRGQLQFWWRATRDASCGNYSDLLARHAEVWGTTDKSSPVEVDIRDVRNSTPRPCAHYEWNPNARGGQGGWRLTWESPFGGSSLPYALFPFQGAQPVSREGPPKEAPARFIETASFTLRLRYPDALEQDVKSAVWAWVNFGGLGARTRRGCGALWCQELAPSSIGAVQDWFAREGAGASGPAREWPTIPRNLLIGPSTQTPVDAWKTVIGLLQEFRQGTGSARNHGQERNRPGRSRYPEPETIRRVTNQRSRRHGRLHCIPDDAFPRAEFGLPIVFHFPPQQGEPRDTVLYPSAASNGKPRERMASPLILKPLALASGKAVPLIIRLHTPELMAVELRSPSKSWGVFQANAIRGKRLAIYNNSPLAGAPSGSAIDAFVHHVQTKRFREVP